jgi:biotin carboxyl carrier protein
MNLDRVEKLVRLFGGSRARELVVEAEGWQVTLRRNTTPAPETLTSFPSPTLLDTADEDDLLVQPATTTITAPLVGIFRQGEMRLAPGDRVGAGSPVGGIESMKILNPVIAHVGGEVLEVLVEDAHPVEYGQALFVLLPLPESEEEEVEP